MFAGLIHKNAAQFFKKVSALIFTTLLPVTSVCASTWDQFFDKQDGMLDASTFVLDNSTGFMPLPIIITEPALGSFGAGAAMAFFHESKDEKSRRQSGEIEELEIPPSVSGAAAAYTANDSWLGAGFHQGSYKQDSIRYLGALGTANINLTFYGRAESNNINDDGEEFTIEGNFLIQDIRFRVGNSKLFIGAEYTYLNSDTRFDVQGIPDISNEKLEASTAGAGLIVFYDSRDNYFTPVTGVDGKLVYTFYREGLGSDFDFDKLKVSGHGFWMVRDHVQLALRADIKSITSGQAPFWEVPYIGLRGIPMLRYQGEVTAVGEVEGRYDFTPRWSVNGFVGAGQAADEVSHLGDVSTRVTKGIGFRYLIMRLLKARVGIDIARGPEDTAIYFTFGSAWSMD
jgi:hypothetical protein